MATVTLGNIKLNWKGAYNAGTAYTIDDVVSYNGSSYVAKTATTGNLPTVTANWDLMSQAGTNGTNGTDLTSTLTTQGDILYRDGSGLQRLGYGTSGNVLTTKGSGQNPVWEPAVGGKVLQVIQKTDVTRASASGSADNNPEAPRLITHLEQAITPSATSSKILITVTLLGSAENNAFPNISYKSSAQASGGFFSIHSGTAVHTTSPGGQTPAMGSDFENGSSNNRVRNATYSFLHSPNTTSAIYYTPTASIWGAQTFYYNRGETDSTAGWYGAGMSSITLMEIGA